MKDNFLATLSHELRTPLNAILGWTQLLMTGRLSHAEKERALEIIDRNIRAQTRLVSDLLDMSRIVSGKFSLEPGRVELSSMITSVLDGFRMSAEVAGVEIRADLESPGAELVADPNRLEQILSNLVSNAIKFSRPGGKITIQSVRNDDTLEIRISDEGIGIRPEFLPYIFDRFRQADASKTRRHGGLGLGLSIVRHLVEAHGGTIHARSAGEGKGTTFILRFPSAPSAAVQTFAYYDPSEAVPFHPAAIRGIKVLMVDDNPDARALIGRQLGELEAVVLEAGSAHEAWSKFEYFRPDVIVSDIGMPDEDGYDLIRRIRTLDAGRDVPAIALTAFVRPEDREEAFQAGYQAHVAKPVEIQKLARTIARVTGRRAPPNAPPAAEPSVQKAGAQGAARLKILVVDDSEDSAGYVSAALGFLGHEVITAHDGTSAVEISARSHPDVVLLDIALPDIDGFEVARRIRRQSGMDKAMIVALTGYCLDQGGPDAYLFDRFLQKPLDPDTLDTFIRKAAKSV